MIQLCLEQGLCQTKRKGLCPWGQMSEVPALSQCPLLRQRLCPALRLPDPAEVVPMWLSSPLSGMTEAMRFLLVTQPLCDAKQ